MLVIHTISELQSELKQRRQAGQSLALVPTMGNLHPGHLQLISTAQQHAETVIVTIFVNPTQFSAHEDLDSYPRTFKDDCQKLESLNTDILFAPSIDEIYPLGGKNTSHVHVPHITEVLCGASRPRHFDGVTTIVCKLFNICQADIAVFGEKDFQQLAVIRRMVEDLNIPIRIIGEPIVREADGLAMSSRNGYLSEEERAIAPSFHQILQHIKQAILTTDANLNSVVSRAKKDLMEAGFKPDYLHSYQRNELKPATQQSKKLIIVAAAFLGSTRLIDNVYVNRT